MQCVIHIGTEKTGTTTLQNFLYENREVFGCIGYHIPISAGIRNNKKLAISAFDLGKRYIATKSLGIVTDSDLKEFQRETIHKLKKELSESKKDKVIFSSEDISAQLLTSQEVIRLKNIIHDLGFMNTKIMVYLRNPAELVNSRYSTSIRCGSVLPSVKSPSQNTNYCDYKKLLMRWCDVFGKKNVIVRVFDRDDLVGGNIVYDFLATCEIENLSSPIITEDMNTSISSLGLEILRRLNKLIPYYVDYRPNQKRKGLVGFVEKNFTQEKFLMPSALFDQYEKYYEDSNEWVRVNYFPDRKILFKKKSRKYCMNMPFDSISLDQIAVFISDIWNHRQ